MSILSIVAKDHAMMKNELYLNAIQRTSDTIITPKSHCEQCMMTTWQVANGRQGR